MTASSDKERISELNSRITAFQNRVPKDNQERGDIALSVLAWNNEKAGINAK